MRTVTIIIVLFGITALTGFGVGRLAQPVDIERELERTADRGRGESEVSEVDASSVVAATYRGGETTADVLSRVPVPSLDGEFSGRVTGWVRTLDGTAASGVEIALRYTGTPSSLDIDAERVTLERYLENAAQLHRVRRDLGRRTTTADDGSFTFDDVGSGPYTLRAVEDDRTLRLDPSSTATTAEHLSKVAAGEHVEVFVVPCGVAEVDLIGLVDGESRVSLRFRALVPETIDPPAGSSPTASGALPGQEHFLRWTLENRDLSLPAGEYEVHIIDPRYRLVGADDASRPTISLGVGDRRRIELSVERRFRVFGMVLESGGAPVEQGRVRAKRGEFPMPKLEPDSWQDPIPDPDHQMWLNDGAFTFTGVEAGTYTLFFGRDWQSVESRLVVEVDRDVDVEHRFPEPDASDFVEIEVRGPGGEIVDPPPTFSLSTIRGKRRDSSAMQIASVSADFSTYRVARPTPKKKGDPSERPEYAVVVRSPMYGDAVVDVAFGAARPYQVRFEEPSKLFFTIDGFADHPHRGKVRVALRSDAGDGGDGSSPRSDFDSDGTIELGPVSPGTYEIKIEVVTKQWSHATIETIPVTITDGENRARATLPPMERVVIRTSDATGSWAQLKSLDDDQGFSDGARPENGVFTFPVVPHGRYRFELYGDSMGHMDLEVRSPVDVQYSRAEVDRYWVTITDSTGTLATAGLQDGDQILSVDGQTLEGMKGRFVIGAASAKPEITLALLRNGQPLDLVVPGSSIGWSRERGGTLEAGTAVRP